MSFMKHRLAYCSRLTAGWQAHKCSYSMLAFSLAGCSLALILAWQNTNKDPLALGGTAIAILWIAILMTGILTIDLAYALKARLRRWHQPVSAPAKTSKSKTSKSRTAKSRTMAHEGSPGFVHLIDSLPLLQLSKAEAEAMQRLAGARLKAIYFDYRELSAGDLQRMRRRAAKLYHPDQMQNLFDLPQLTAIAAEELAIINGVLDRLEAYVDVKTQSV